MNLLKHVRRSRPFISIPNAQRSLSHQFRTFRIDSSMHVEELARRTPINLIKVQHNTLIKDAAQLMEREKIGAVMVEDHKNTIVGILTTRDVQSAVSLYDDLATIQVQTVMTKKEELTVATKADTLRDIESTMMERNIRHIPIMDGDICEGILSIKDIVFEIKEIEPDLPQLRIGCIGGGQMASALSIGIINSGILAHGSSMIISDKITGKLTKILNTFKSMDHTNVTLETTVDNKQCIKNCDIVFIAVKPQYLDEVMKELRDEWNGNEIIVSIIAGVTLDTIERGISNKSRQKVIRTVPNTPLLIGCGAIGITKGEYATDEDLSLIKTILKAIGVVKTIDKEALLDVVTGLSGGGPAYVFMLIEAMTDGGVKCGLPRDIALELAAQCVYGSAKMVLQTGKNPKELADAVASPGGTTIEGIMSLEKNAFRYTVMSAVEAASNKSALLGLKSKQKEYDYDNAKTDKVY